MKIAIRYYTQTKLGNTKKIADRLSDALEVPALPVSEKLNEDVDVLFLLDAMYANDVNKAIKEFLKEPGAKIGTIYNICSSCSGRSTAKKIRKLGSKLGLNISEKDYACHGQWLGLMKGHPTEEELQGAVDFAKTALEQE